jgi:hypothetical protein
VAHRDSSAVSDDPERRLAGEEGEEHDGVTTIRLFTDELWSGSHDI